MFVDEVVVTFMAGDGGNGKASFFPGYKSGPNGGNGGNGGNLYVSSTSDLTVLNHFTQNKVIRAENGENGHVNRKSGKSGKDITVLLPLGSEITDLNTGEVFVLGSKNQTMLFCRRGIGGRGTYELRSPSNTTPLHGEAGTKGQIRRVKIVLKLIADYGLIGLPNTGKSSLLNELTRANVKVADYPFTTLEPNLGTLDGKVIADIPGLIEGASEGHGLGIKFLKHIEKVNLVLHCISSESDHIEADYQTVRKELEKFNPSLLQKPEIILLTKSDNLDEVGLETGLKITQKLGKVIAVSIYDSGSLGKLRKLLKH